MGVLHSDIFVLTKLLIFFFRCLCFGSKNTSKAGQRVTIRYEVKKNEYIKKENKKQKDKIMENNLNYVLGKPFSLGRDLKRLSCCPNPETVPESEKPRYEALRGLFKRECILAIIYYFLFLFLVLCYNHFLIC